MKHLNRDDVTNAKTFAQYAHQRSGVPYPTFKEIAALTKYLNGFLDKYPNMGYGELCDLVDWTVSQKKRFYNTIQLVEAGHRMAWTKRAIPALNVKPQDQVEQERVSNLLKEKYLPEDWRRRFMLAQTVQERSAVLALWDQEGDL